MPPEAVRAQLTIITAKRDAIEINGRLDPDTGPVAPKMIDSRAIYRQRNAPAAKGA